MSTGKQQQQQQNKNRRANVSPSPSATAQLPEFSQLDYLESLGVGISAVIESAAEQGLSTKDVSKLNIDEEAFEDVMVSHLHSLRADERQKQVGDEIDGVSGDDDSEDDYDASKRVNASIDKKEGDNYTITQCYNFTGTLKAFAEGKASTKKTMICSDMRDTNHRPLVKESKILQVHNTTPFVIDFKLDGARSTNIQMDDKDGTHKNVSYMILSDIMSPMYVGASIFSHGEDVDFELDDLQEKYAYATESDIRSSVQFPSIQEFIGDKIPSKREIEQYENAKQSFAKAEQHFVLKSSPLGEFISSDISNSRIPLAWENKLPNHHLLPAREIESKIEEMKHLIVTSPIGKMHGMTGSIARNDGEAWDHIPEGITEEEARHLLNTRQTITVLVEHHVQAHLGD